MTSYTKSTELICHLNSVLMPVLTRQPQSAAARSVLAYNVCLFFKVESEMKEKENLTCGFICLFSQSFAHLIQIS